MEVWSVVKGAISGYTIAWLTARGDLLQTFHVAVTRGVDAQRRPPQR